MRYKNDSIFNFFVLFAFLIICVSSNDFNDYGLKIISDDLRSDLDISAPKAKIEEISDLVSKNSEKIIFLLQMQKVNRKLKIFSLVNFDISKNEKFNFTIDKYTINSRRYLLQNELKEIEFYSLDDYNGNDDKIVILESYEEIEENVGAILKTSENGNNIKIKSNENKNNLDTEKVQEEINKGGIDYNNIPLNHKIYKYPIITSNEGCEFFLNISENIEINNEKNINLSFIEVDNDTEKINAECLLSKDNRNEIHCNLSQEVDKKYFLEPFIYSDQAETITIFQNNFENHLSLKCNINNNNNTQNGENSSGGLSGGEVLGIILGVLEAIIILLIYFLLIRKKKKPGEDNDSYLLNKERNI